MPATTSRAAPGSPAHGRGRVAAELAVGLVPLLLAAAATARRLDLPRDYVPAAVAAYGLFAAAVQGLLPPQPWPGLGAANRVTVGRAALVLSLAALVPHAQALSSAGLWWIIGMAIAALCLDGVDGLVARRTGTGTAFGARFDMELDSFLMLVLAALVWRSGRLDAWILLLGGAALRLRRGRPAAAVAAGSPAATAPSQGGMRRPGRRPRRLSRPRRPPRTRRRRERRSPWSCWSVRSRWTSAGSSIAGGREPDRTAAHEARAATPDDRSASARHCCSTAPRGWSVPFRRAVHQRPPRTWCCVCSMESKRPVSRAICQEFTRPARAPTTAATAVRSSTMLPTIVPAAPHCTINVLRTGARRIRAAPHGSSRRRQRSVPWLTNGSPSTDMRMRTS